MPKRLDTLVSDAGEVADCEPCCHHAIVNPPLTGQSIGERGWVAKEMVGDHVTIEVTEVIEHYGHTIVRGRYDGTFDKANLPDELILTTYFTVRDGPLAAVGVTMPPWPGADEAYDVPGPWSANPGPDGPDGPSRGLT